MNLVSIFENPHGASTIKFMLSMPICMDKLVINKELMVYVIYCNACIYLFFNLPVESYITLGAWEFTNNISILRPEYGDW